MESEYEESSELLHIIRLVAKKFNALFVGSSLPEDEGIIDIKRTITKTGRRM